jgi:hypothetical protein
MQVTRKSMLTGKIHTREINCTQAQMDIYDMGFGLVQDLFPNLSPDDREYFPEGDEEA